MGNTASTSTKLATTKKPRRRSTKSKVVSTEPNLSSSDGFDITDADVEKAMRDFRPGDSTSIMMFGSRATEGTTELSKRILDESTSVDLGPIGDSLLDMTSRIREINDASDPNRGNFLTRWLKAPQQKIQSIADQFAASRTHIDNMSKVLADQAEDLMVRMQNMYELLEQTYSQLRDVIVYIKAAERILDKYNNETIPELQKKVAACANDDDDYDHIRYGEALNDAIMERDQLERKLHDLRVIRQISKQELPKIRVTIESDNALFGKLQSMRSSTVQLWIMSMANAMDSTNAKRTADIIDTITDVTGEMMSNSTKLFKDTTVQVRKSVEKSVVPIEAVKKMNQDIIDTFTETMSILNDGKVERENAAHILAEADVQLMEAMIHNNTQHEAYLMSDSTSKRQEALAYSPATEVKVNAKTTSRAKTKVRRSRAKAES